MASLGSSVILFGGNSCGEAYDDTWEYLEAKVEGTSCAQDQSAELSLRRTESAATSPARPV